MKEVLLLFNHAAFSLGEWFLAYDEEGGGREGIRGGTHTLSDHGVGQR